MYKMPINYQRNITFVSAFRAFRHYKKMGSTVSSHCLLLIYIYKITPRPLLRTGVMRNSVLRSNALVQSVKSMSYLLPLVVIELAAEMKDKHPVIVHYLYRSQMIAACKSKSANLLQSRGDSKVTETVAAAESIPAQSYGALGKCDAFQVLTAAEGGICDDLNGIRHQYPHKIGTAAERALVDDADVIGNKDLLNALLIPVPLEHTSFDLIIHSVFSLSKHRSISPEPYRFIFIVAQNIRKVNKNGPSFRTFRHLHKNTPPYLQGEYISALI